MRNSVKHSSGTPILFPYKSDLSFFLNSDLRVVQRKKREKFGFLTLLAFSSFHLKELKPHTSNNTTPLVFFVTELLTKHHPLNRKKRIYLLASRSSFLHFSHLDCIFLFFEENFFFPLAFVFSTTFSLSEIFW